MQRERRGSTSGTARAMTTPARVRNSASTVPESVHSALDRSGTMLPAHDRAAMEARFGHSFANVRIYHDALAARSADDVHADAYSYGSKIVFGNGVYRPGERRSRSVLAHELAHVVQQPHTESRPQGIAKSDAPAEREAQASASTFERGRSPRLSAGTASSELIHRQPKGAAQEPVPQQPAPQQPADPQGTQKPADDVRTRARSWLDQSHFDLPLVADSPTTAGGSRRVFYGQKISTLDAVADDVTDVLGQTMPGVFSKAKRTDQWTHLRTEIWTHVWQYYNEKKDAAEKDRWQTVIQVLYTPQATFYSNPAGAVPPTQQSLQVSGGQNYRLHPAGASGFELQAAASVSLFNLGSGKTDVFQNALVSIQAQHVWNLGHEFRIAPEVWANLQASVFAQLAAGVGGSYSDTAQGDRKLDVGFLVQPSAGGQVNLNIGWFQVIAQGSAVYSYLSKTTQQGSTPTNSAAVQFGLGVGAQF